MREMISHGHVENKLMYPHRNQGMEIVLVEKGHLEWAVDRVPEVLNPGTVFFTLPWQTHGSLMLREPPNRIFFTLFTLSDSTECPNDRFRFPQSLQFTEEDSKVLAKVYASAHRHAWPATALLQEIFPELVRRLDGTSKLDAIAATSLHRTLVVELADIIRRAQDGPQWLSPTVRTVKVFLAQVAESLDHPWTLDEMAEQCGVKRTQFANITKRLTGYAPAHYLHRVRFDKSCELLRTTVRSVTDIAFECGYSSSQYFSETFKKQARITPSEYRKSVPELDAIMQNNWDHPEWRSLEEERRRAATIRTVH